MLNKNLSKRTNTYSPMRRTAISLSLTILALLQVSYWILGQNISSPMIYIMASTLLILGLVDFLASPTSRLGMISTPTLVLGIATICYGAIFALLYDGSNIAEYVQPITTLLLFWLVLFAIVRANDAYFSSSKLFLLIIAGISLLQVFALRDFSLDISDKLHGTATRYGYTEGVNVINVTAANLAFVLLSAYITLRRGWSPVWTTVILFVIITLAYSLILTGSRTGVMMVVTTIFLFEARLALGRTIFVALLVALCLIAIIIFLPVFEGNTFTLGMARVIERFTTISDPSDIAAYARYEALLQAFTSGAVIFGYGETPQEYLGSSTDNVISSITISFGVVGLVLLSAFLYRLLWSFFHTRGWPLLPIFAVFPLLVRGMGEGFFIEKSTLFSMSLFLCTASVSPLRSVKCRLPATSSFNSPSNERYML